MKNLEHLLKDIHKRTKISDNEGKWFGIEDVYGVFSKWNPETGEYCTDKDLMTGKKLLSETNGYENYCTKEELKKIAQAEQNLLYLAQMKKLNSATIYTIAMNHPVSEDILVGLYQCGAFTLKRVETYVNQKGMNLNHIKEKIKEQKFKEYEMVDLNDKETWELLTPEERLQIAAKSIKKGEGKTIQERIEELYDIQEIANLYKELYHERGQEEHNQEFQEKRKKYENLITLHNALGMQNREDIILLLEEDLSDEMLTNLYSDHVISMDVLESYGDKELVIEAFEQGKLHEKDMREAILRYPIPLEEQQIYQYHQQGILIPRDILTLYINDRINLDTIKRINEKLPEEQNIRCELREEELAKLYQNAKEEKKRKSTNLDATIKYKRYGLVYQTLERANLNERKRLASDKKILEHMHNVTPEDIMELYKDNLLTLDSALEYGGNELVKKLALQGDLRTNDARRYFESEEVNVNIKELLQNPDMDEAEKLILIYTTYGDNKKKREELVNYLSAYATDIKGESSTQKGKGNGKEGDKKTVTDPYERWKLFTLLDKNYSRKYVGGYLVVKLHNMQKVIIEKMYEKKNKKNIPAYGTATFTLDADEYEKLEKEFVMDNKFNIAKVRKIAKENPEQIAKITHHPPVLDENGNERNSWGKRILENVYGNELEKIYTKKEIAEIEDCMKAIERSRQDLER